MGMCESICILPSFSHDVGNNIKWDIMWYISPMLYILLSCGITESQNSWDWKGSLEVIWSKPLFKQGHLGCPRPCSGSFWVSPGYPHPHSNKSVSWCLGGTSCISVCAHCLLSCHWAPLKEAVFILSAPFLQVFIYIDEILPWAFSSPGWTASGLSTFPHMRGAPVP